VVFFSNPSLTYVTPAGCSNFVFGDRISGGTHNETAASGGPVVSNNPCVVTNVAGPYSRVGSALLR
jgi:hypothetical protein